MNKGEPRDASLYAFHTTIEPLADTILAIAQQHLNGEKDIRSRPGEWHDTLEQCTCLPTVLIRAMVMPYLYIARYAYRLEYDALYRELLPTMSELRGTLNMYRTDHYWSDEYRDCHGEHQNEHEMKLDQTTSVFLPAGVYLMRTQILDTHFLMSRDAMCLTISDYLQGCSLYLFNGQKFADPIHIHTHLLNRARKLNETPDPTLNMLSGGMGHPLLVKEHVFRVHQDGLYRKEWMYPQYTISWRNVSTKPKTLCVGSEIVIHIERLGMV